MLNNVSSLWKTQIINQKNLQNKNVRLLYQGKILMDGSSLLSLGLKGELKEVELRTSAHHSCFYVSRRVVRALCCL